MAEEPESGKRFDDSELLDMCQGDLAQARLLRKSLETLATGHGGDALKEMAQEVLSGRVGLRDAMNVSAYADQLIEEATPMAERWASLPETQREELAAEGRGAITAEQDQIDEEQRTGPDKGGSRMDRHSARGWSLY